MQGQAKAKAEGKYVVSYAPPSAVDSRAEHLKQSATGRSDAEGLADLFAMVWP